VKEMALKKHNTKGTEKGKIEGEKPFFFAHI